MNSHQLPLRVRVGGTIIIVCGLTALCLAGLQTAWRLPSFDYLLLVGLTVLISQRAVKIPGSQSSISASETLIFFAILRFGGPAATLVAAADGLLASRSIIGKPGSRFKLFFNVGLLSFSAYAAGDIFVKTPWLLARVFSLPPESSTYRIVPLVGMVLAHFLINSGSMSMIAAGTERKPLFEIWRHNYLWTAASYFAAASTAVFVLTMAKLVGLYALMLSLPIITFVYLTYRNYSESIKASQRNLEAAERHAEEMAALHLRTIEALAIAIDAKDQITHDHVQRVQIYAEGLARVFGLSHPEMKALHAAALLHDIGKLAVPDYILNKPGKLTAAEFEKMKVHTVVGMSILERVGFPYPLVPIVKHHHERWDGTGYPDGLRSEEIPITARILAVVDCFDAVREDRQYRKAMTREQAINLLRRERGKSYDPQVVDTFLEHLPVFEEQIARRTVLSIASPTLDLRAASEAMRVALPAAGLADPAPMHYLGEIRAAHQEVAELFDLAQTLPSTLDVKDTISIIADKINRLVPFDTCAIYLMDERGDKARVAYTTGRYAEYLRFRQISLGHGITGYALANGCPFYNTDPALDLEGLGPEVQGAFKTVAVYPLAKAEKMIGAITLFSSQQERYSDEQLRVIERIVPLAADALYNAVSYQRTEACALTDVLTGLPNSRILATAFEQERSRADRHDTSLTMLMMDLDGFKEVNDTFGHQVGDRVLHDIAQRLKQELRGGDTLLRYAGDEFIALLHRTEERVIAELIRRIQASVEGYRHVIRGEEARVGVSIGYAVYGKDGKTLEELMRVADSGMYRNKAERKQQQQDKVKTKRVPAILSTNRPVGVIG